MPRLRTVRLPDGRHVRAIRPFDALLLFRELVEDRPYEKHGIALRAGDTVFDVGANIGLFAITAAASVPGLRIHCFEPIPSLFEALQQNLAVHAPAATAERVALGRSSGSADLTFDPYSTVTGSMYPGIFRQAADPRATTLAWARAALADFERVRPGGIGRWLGSALSHERASPFVLAALAPFAVYLEVRKRLCTRVEHCRVRSLSNVLRTLGRPRVDLVKIDVEGAEEDVLLGIEDDDWPLLRQFAIEVHDLDGRLDRLTRLLAGRGYRTARDREPWALHAVMNISTLYAFRAS